MNQDEIIARFMKRKAEIDTIIASIQTMSDEHFGVDPDRIHMGHVGNMAHAARELRIIRRFLSAQKR